ncbi:kinase-like domain-containing protein [Gigaspora rosea]|uniref:Kinase-like domain-containing protein n=1 Tax=Gigaspora rosea TaxID=44941 RepID=A0A397U267_9GLOM|nr:kinase-like domain-containing protein [Gigaspora rosea]
MDKIFLYKDTIEWIPFDRLSDIKEIGKGGFGSIYRATCSDGIRKIEKIKIDDKHKSNNDNYIYKRSREPNRIVALKTLSSSKRNQNFLDILREYANDGNIHKFLRSNFNQLTWKFMLEQLKNISFELFRIHNANYIHSDLHSGNILHNKGTSYISDLGLSKKVEENSSKDVIFGIMPYIAPEVLSGKQQFTQKADIYGFGVIMAEITTGQKPFDGYKFDIDLAIKICNGLRPNFASGTPNCYVELASLCMNSDPQERPDAWDINCEINNWIEKLTSDDENEIKNQFSNAGIIINTLPIVPQIHSDHMYTSKMIDTQKILNAIKGN